MRKTFLLWATLFMTALAAKADIAPTVMLHHAGKTTLFAWDKVQDAVDAAANGDTIYLSNGQFSAFNVNKRIMVRGTGVNTIIQGSCTICISGSTPLNMPVLDAIRLTGNVSVTGADSQFTLRKCEMMDLNFTDNDFRDVKLIQCYIKGTLHLTQHVKEFTCYNTKIRTLHPYDYLTGDAQFVNCNIRMIDDNITATFDNCVLRSCLVALGNNYYGVCLNDCKLNYCIYPVRGSNSYNSYYLDIGGKATTSYGCFFYDPTVKFNNCYQVKIDAENVVDYGSDSQLGMDGTKVGVYGGQQPFTLNPALPRVTNHSVTVDAKNKKLNVKLTVTKD